jgi:hypothetical protein
MMGLNFKKELTLADEQIYPPMQHLKGGGQTRLQERLVKKLGPTSYPFQLNFPKHSPTSVSLISGPDDEVNILTSGARGLSRPRVSGFVFYSRKV